MSQSTKNPLPPPFSVKEAQLDDLRTHELCSEMVRALSLQAVRLKRQNERLTAKVKSLTATINRMEAKGVAPKVESPPPTTPNKNIIVIQRRPESLPEHMQQ
jgi:hypothetical protein